MIPTLHLELQGLLLVLRMPCWLRRLPGVGRGLHGYARLACAGVGLQRLRHGALGLGLRLPSIRLRGEAHGVHAAAGLLWLHLLAAAHGVGAHKEQLVPGPHLAQLARLGLWLCALGA